MKRKISMACKNSQTECKHGLFVLNKRSVKTVSRPVKSQGTFHFLSNGNHVIQVLIFPVISSSCPEKLPLGLRGCDGSYIHGGKNKQTYKKTSKQTRNLGAHLVEATLSS